MDEVEAHKILGEQLARFNNYAKAVQLAQSEHIENFEISGISGTAYQVEIQFFWDDNKKSNVRVFGSIDDGGFRVILPITQTLLLCPNL